MFDGAKLGALRLTMQVWHEHRTAYLKSIVDDAKAFTQALGREGISVLAKEKGTINHTIFFDWGCSFWWSTSGFKRFTLGKFSGLSGWTSYFPSRRDLNGLRIITYRWCVGVTDVL